MTSKTTGTGMEAAELASLRRRLAEACENLSIIEEKKSLYVMEVDIPPQLIKRERRLKRKIAELEQRIAGLEAAAATAAEAAGEQAPSTAPPDPASATTPSACHRPETEDCYSRYEIGLRRLLEQLGADHPRYSEALTYQHRLIENIEQARRHGDTETLRAERSRIIEQLNRFALEEVGTPFNDLCKAVPDQPSHPPPTVLIPAGPFWMGSYPDDAEAHDNERPRRKVQLPAYQIGRYPVTNAQYAAFVRATGHSPPGHWGAEIPPADLEDHPVVNVNYEDAEAYCRWLSESTGEHYRLPTEEEWEKAARGGCPEERRYPWGDEWRYSVCNTEELGLKGTTSVHEFESVNRSPFGVVDVAGNVWEWTSSWYQGYPGSPHKSPRYGHKYRVVRGGSWAYSAYAARISCRGRYEPHEHRPYLGFRIVLNVPPDGN